VSDVSWSVFVPIRLYQYGCIPVYQPAGLLWRKIQAGFSASRVQRVNQTCQATCRGLVTGCICCCVLYGIGIFCILINIFLIVCLPCSFAGFAVTDAILGRYLTPRIWNVDIKMFFLYNISALGYMAVTAVIVIEAYQQEKLTAAMILMTLYTAVIGLMWIIHQVGPHWNFWL